jgi:hypothetical protein
MMQSSYQYSFGSGAPVFGGGSLWGDQSGFGSGDGGAGAFSLGSLIQEVGCHEKNASSVKEYAYTEDKNFRFRPTMEDSKSDSVTYFM